MQQQLFWRSMNNSPDRLTETDSGQWSSSFPSSPIKEQSPVHQTGATNAALATTTRHTAHSSSSKKSDLYGTPSWADWDDDENCDQNETMLTSLTSQSSSMTASRNSHEMLRLTPPPPPPSAHLQQKPPPQVQNLKSMAFTIDFNTAEIDATDVKSENGTYTLDEEPREPVDVCSGNDNSDDNNYNGVGSGVIGNGSGGQDWIVQWASDAAGRLNSYGDCQYSSNETKEILSETEKIVESMQNRVTNVQRSKSNLSPSATKKYPTTSNIKLNRAFNIRRTLNTNSPSNASYDSDGSERPPTLPPPSSKNNNEHFSRSDGGRFSLRMSRGDKRNYNTESDPEGRATTIPSNRSQHFSRQSPLPRPTSLQPVKLPSNPPPKFPTPQQLSHKNPPAANSSNSLNKKTNVRSNSTMSSRDIELENWRRRKSYDPLRSSGMIAQRVPVGNCNSSINSSVNNVSSSNNEFKETSSSSNLTNDRKKSLTDNQRSPIQDSFNRKKDFLRRSSVKPVNPPPSPTTVKGNSLIPQQCCGKSTRAENAAFSCGEEHARAFSDYKNHQCQMQGHLEQRKFEALDTLVISTIHSLSTKVRNLSLNLLKKIQPTHGEDENGALIEEMITQLTELSQSQNCNNTTSKELSGTLKNIKKIEQVVLDIVEKRGYEILSFILIGAFDKTLSTRDSNPVFDYVLDRVLCDESCSESED